VRALDASEPIPYFISEGDPDDGYRPEDRQLAGWALRAWQEAAPGAVELRPAPEERALLRVYWVPAAGGQYGEMRSFHLGNKRGAAIFVRPVTDGLGRQLSLLARQDPLLRDTIIYLTCLHELGHAFGLDHTTNYDSIMYFFGYGGDIPRFFLRYRRKLEEREDFAKVSGLSEDDVQEFRQRYLKERVH